MENFTCPFTTINKTVKTIRPLLYEHCNTGKGIFYLLDRVKKDNNEYLYNCLYSLISVANRCATFEYVIGTNLADSDCRVEFGSYIELSNMNDNDVPSFIDTFLMEIFIQSDKEIYKHDEYSINRTVCIDGNTLTIPIDQETRKEYILDIFKINPENGIMGQIIKYVLDTLHDQDDGEKIYNAIMEALSVNETE